MLLLFSKPPQQAAQPEASPNRGQLRVYIDDTSWVIKPVKVWNGTAWVKKPVRYWNGSAWVFTFNTVAIQAPLHAEDASNITTESGDNVTFDANYALAQDSSDPGFFTGGGATENSSDPGFYIIQGNAAQEDASEPGTYIIGG